MKTTMLLLSILFLLFGISISSCKKTAVIKDGLITSASNSASTESLAPITLIGKWNIVTDSAYNTVGCCYEHKVYYAGQPGDYFDFRNDGKLYTKEGAAFDTVSYKLTSDTTILISSFGMNGMSNPSHITNLTAHNANITSANLLTPGGFSWRRSRLSR